MNKLIVSGRLVKDPVEKEVNGKKVASFSIAVNMKYGETESAEFFRVTAWKGVADIVLKYAKKGTKVLLSGPVSLNRYEKDGKEYANNEIRYVESFELISTGPADNQSSKPNTAKQQKAEEPSDDDDLPF